MDSEARKKSNCNAKGEFGRADKPDENPRRAPRAPLRTVEPFSGRRRHTGTGELHIQFLRQRRRANILRSGGVVVL